MNNVWVNACNHGFDARRYFDALDGNSIGEFHLAGFERDDDLLIDTHGTRVAPEVWSLYRDAVQSFGMRPTVVEWDTDLPALDVLLAEAREAEEVAA